jgi:ribosomal protein S18 acetylase RimI-like enzyme
MTVTLRPALPSDEGFLRDLIVDTVAGELGASAWPEPMRSHLLGVQYTARRHSSRVDFPEATSQVIQANGGDAGWVLVNAMRHETRLIEIMVAPELRGKGIGTAVIRELLANAFQAGKPMRLSVNVTNSGAIQLYERLGFRRIDGNEVQHIMEAHPDQVAALCSSSR